MSATLYLADRVRPCDGVTPPGEALVVRGGRVAGVGTRDDMRRLAGPGAEVVDVRGATILPGLVDTHPHLLHFAAFAAPLVDLADAVDHADIVARLAARAAETPAGEWIMASPVGEPHYFIRRSWRDLAEGALPDRHVLDRAAPDHPLFIQAWAPVTPNVCALNSLGLARLGLTRATPDQVGHVWIEKDRAGEPTGILRGAVNNYYSNDAFMNSLLRQLPLLQPEAALAGTRRAMADYNRLGVTTIYEGHAMGVGEIGAWQLLRQQGALDGPAQRVSRAAAVAMWTRDAARAIGWPGVGTLAPGSYADLIMLDRDPLTCALEELPATRVLRTVLGGASPL